MQDGRSDGTNDASVIDRRWIKRTGWIHPPCRCEPLFEATVLNRAPRTALDGVSTLPGKLDRSAVSLFTYRFADVAETNGEFERLATVLDNCRDNQVEVHARPAAGACSPASRPHRRRCAGADRLHADHEQPCSQAGRSCANPIATPSLAVRYEPVPGTFAPLTARRLMDSLMEIEDAHGQDLQQQLMWTTSPRIPGDRPRWPPGRNPRKSQGEVIDRADEPSSAP